MKQNYKVGWHQLLLLQKYKMMSIFGYQKHFELEHSFQHKRLYRTYLLAITRYNLFFSENTVNPVAPLVGSDCTSSNNPLETLN